MNTLVSDIAFEKDVIQRRLVIPCMLHVLKHFFSVRFCTINDQINNNKNNNTNNNNNNNNKNNNKSKDKNKNKNKNKDKNNNNDNNINYTIQKWLQTIGLPCQGN